MSPDPSRQPPERRWRRRPRSARGFSLVELIVVVIIIAVLAVLAIPAVTAQMRDRRTQHVAQEIAGFYRNARTRAMGRGAAVLVRYDSSVSAAGIVQVREAIRGQGQANPNCEELPVSSCSLTTWAATDSKELDFLDPASRGEYAGINIELYRPALPNSAAAPPKEAKVDICFTPMGRAFVRFDTVGPFVPMTGVSRAKVVRLGGDGLQNGLARNVLVMPSGHARAGQAEGPP